MFGAGELLRLYLDIGVGGRSVRGWRMMSVLRVLMGEGRLCIWGCMGISGIVGPSSRVQVVMGLLL